RLDWRFMMGTVLSGLGDFSRTFLVLRAGRALGETGGSPAGGALSGAVLLYAMHNLVSAASAYPVGHLADRTSRVRILIGGYGLGVATNLLLATCGGQLACLIVAIILSAIYIGVEETLEKAVLAGWLPRERRSLGLGYLACFNAVGDMVSSLYVGSLIQAGRPGLAFGLAAGAGALGVAWLSWVGKRTTH